MLRHAEPAQANLWVLRSPLHHMQLLPTTAVTRYQACTRRVSPHLRPSPAQIQVRSSGLRGHAGTLSYPDRRTRKGKPIRSEEHTSELQSRFDLVCRLL